MSASTPGLTRARFYVASTEEFGTPDENGQCSGKVKLNAVSRGDQNKQWASATPSGTLEMYINNPPAFEAIRGIQRAGMDVELTLTPVHVNRPEDGHPFRQSTADSNTAYGGEGKCGDCGFDRVDAYSKRPERLITHKSDLDEGWVDPLAVDTA